MFKLEFETTNAAFVDEEDRPAFADEVSRILSVISTQVLDGLESGNVVDVNGNTVGSWSLS